MLVFSWISVPVDLLLIILVVLIFKHAYWTFTRVIEKPKIFSDEKKLSLVTPVSSLLEVKITLPSRIILKKESVANSYDPWELVNRSVAKLSGGNVGPLFKVVLNDGSIVVVRKIRKGLVMKPTELDICLRFFGQIRGRYLLPMLFAFWYGGEAYVVYEYLCLGSLEELLHGKEGIQCTPLNWKMRCYIALCASMAMSSIHSQVSEKGEALVCGVIKASNILIRTDFSSCLTGYEAPCIVSPEMIIKRNPGRVAPELVKSESSSVVFTQKSDIYSFGVLLLELITGKKPMVSYEKREVMLVDYVKDVIKKEGLLGVYDEKLMGVKDSMAKMVEIAEHCLLQNPNERPTMDRVALMIQQLQD